MRFGLTALIATVLVTPMSLQAQAPWRALIRPDGEAVEFDSSSVRHLADSVLRIRVRFVQGEIGRIPLVYRVQLTDVDCRRARSRVLEVRDDALGVTPPRSGIGAPDSTRWISYPKGSLGSEITNALCIALGSGAANTRGAGT